MQPATEREELLGALLKSVSRSFYLTLRVLPAGLREPVGLAYLLARAADTIADTGLVPPPRRLEFLLALRQQLHAETLDVGLLGEIESALSEHQKDPHERRLLASLTPALRLLRETAPRDRAQIRAVVTTLSEGMEWDLRAFPPEDSGGLNALETFDDLERYTYYVAGCVGEFWTRMTRAHTRALRFWDETEMSACGVRFGKALQYTNILRDIPKDLRIGRCYLPAEMLRAEKLSPQELLDPANSARARPLLFKLLRVALGHYREARRYTLAIPPPLGRLRLACLWPILIGLPTLEKLARNGTFLEPGAPSKVSRGFVQRTLALSLPAVGSDTLVGGWIDARIAAVERAIDSQAAAGEGA
jgi:farnesyl-diphosphate farnesyltransferase